MDEKGIKQNTLSNTIPKICRTNKRGRPNISSIGQHLEMKYF